MNFTSLAARALVAGLIAGLALSAVTLPWATPLILEAETYEHAVSPHDHHTVDSGDHPHGGAEWAPQDGLQRNLYTVLADVLMGMGYALILAAFMALGQARGLKHGLLWGLGGYLTFYLLPAIGLPPELPGMEHADLGERQAWWLLAVSCSGTGLALLLKGERWLLRLLGAGLLLFPHLLGAPQPPAHTSPVPLELVKQFWLASAVANLIFWISLGGALGALIKRRGSPLDRAAETAPK